MNFDHSTNVDFIAELNFKTSDQGGRITPAFSGYRPHIKFPFDDVRTSGRQVYIGQDQVLPGEIVRARIKILSVKHFQNRLSEGMEFEFAEGARVIGTGRILEVVNNKLKKEDL